MEEEQPALTLAAARTSPREARRYVSARVSELGFHRLIDDVVLVASELVTNAVIHAESSSRVTVDLRHGRLRLEVHDDSSVMPQRRHMSEDATTGRGLALVESLSASWGANRAPDGGKVVWADFDPLAPGALSPFDGRR